MINNQKIINKDFWPLLLKNYSKMESIEKISKLAYNDIFPFHRPFKSYIKNAIINLDKPEYSSCNQIIKLVKRIFKISKVGHSNEINSKINGCLVVFLENSVRLIKSHIQFGKTLVGIFKFNYFNTKLKKEFLHKVETLGGFFLQCPFNILTSKHQIKITNIYSTSIHELDQISKTGIVEISCDSNIYFKSISSYFFSKFGNKCKLLELRQIRSGYLNENINLVTFHDLIDSNWFYYSKKSDFYIKKTIMPFEILLTCYKRIVIKNSSINAVCYGAKLMLSGVIRAEKNIGKKDQVLLISIKGEAIAIAIAITNTAALNNQNENCFCIMQNIIMDKDKYPKKWSVGINQTKKKLYATCGILVIKKKNFR
nr:pseudouridylate synthase [Cryptomonas curvata]